jgi:Predicted membrane protein
MESTGSKQAREKSAGATSEHRVSQGSVSTVESTVEKRASGYGLPCLRCHAYYPADMHACPICKTSERVTPTAPVIHSMSPESKPVPVATAAQIDDERERFLKELKSHAFASHTQMDPVATFRCVLDHQHTGAVEPAAVCHSCYSEAKQQVDRMEAAFYMDPKEAAKIVYDAVWADTSDSNKTYLNAATALLTELKKRAGMGLLMGSHQTLTH